MESLGDHLVVHGGLKNDSFFGKTNDPNLSDLLVYFLVDLLLNHLKLKSSKDRK